MTSLAHASCSIIMCCVCQDLVNLQVVSSKLSAGTAAPQGAQRDVTSETGLSETDELKQEFKEREQDLYVYKTL